LRTVSTSRDVHQPQFLFYQVFVRLDAFLWYNVCSWVLFIVERETDDGSVSNRVVIKQKSFEFSRCSLIAFDLDEFLERVLVRKKGAI
jgi:hypothetical protein